MKAVCSICVVQYTSTVDISALVRCGHNFHRTCLSAWTAISMSCPQCRLAILRPGEDVVQKLFFDAGPDLLINEDPDILLDRIEYLEKEFTQKDQELSSLRQLAANQIQANEDLEEGLHQETMAKKKMEGDLALLRLRLEERERELAEATEELKVTRLLIERKDSDSEALRSKNEEIAELGRNFNSQKDANVSLEEENNKVKIQLRSEKKLMASMRLQMKFLSDENEKLDKLNSQLNACQKENVEPSEPFVPAAKDRFGHGTDQAKTSVRAKRKCPAKPRVSRKKACDTILIDE